MTTEQGDVTCEHVVNAAGCYADRVSAWLGVQTTFANMKHQYVVTEPIPEFLERDVELPVMRDPYASAYYRQEQKSGLFGVYEGSDTREAWRDTGGPAWESSNELFEPEFEPIALNLERVMERMPIFADVGIKRVVNGAISHSPDGNPLVGPAAGVRDFWLATASSIGIAQGPGCGKYLAQWMVHGSAEVDMAGLDPRRFGAYADRAYTSAKAHREYWDMYRLIPPGEERPEGRPAQEHAAVSQAPGQGLRLHRGLRLGAAEVVLARRARRGTRLPSQQRVRGRGGRVSCRARTGRRPRTAGLRQVRGVGARCRGLPRPAVRQPHVAPGWWHRARPRPDRGRSDRLRDPPSRAWPAIGSCCCPVPRAASAISTFCAPRSETTTSRW